MSETRLNCLTLTALERDVMKEVPIDEIIDSFAKRKGRKVYI